VWEVQLSDLGTGEETSLDPEESSFHLDLERLMFALDRS